VFLTVKMPFRLIFNEDIKPERKIGFGNRDK